MADREIEGQNLAGFGEGSAAGTVAIAFPGVAGYFLLTVIMRWDAGTGPTGASALRYTLLPILTIPPLYMAATAPTVVSAVSNTTVTINGGSAGAASVAGAVGNIVNVTVPTVGGQPNVSYVYRWQAMALLI